MKFKDWGFVKARTGTRRRCGKSEETFYSHYFIVLLKKLLCGLTVCGYTIALFDDD